MVVTANPYASKAGCDILKAGGTAVDAAVAVQAVLGLVEPQSSGLGGGAFMLHYDARSKAVQSYDGRETAPAAATPNHLRYIDDAADQNTPRPNARASGRSIGTPGAMRLLELAYRDHGKTAWKDLFQPGIKLATDGFPISGRMAAAIDSVKTNFLADAEATATYLNPDRTPKALGTIFRLPAYATTLTAIATVATPTRSTPARSRRPSSPRSTRRRTQRPVPKSRRARRRWPTWPATRPSGAIRSAPPTAPIPCAAWGRRRRAASRSPRRSASSRTSTSACTRRR